MTPSTGSSASINDTVELVKQYAKQETLGPLRGAGRWIGYGLLGAVLLGIGVTFLMLGVLRLLQTEADDTFSGYWMTMVPYVVGLVVGLIVIALAVSRIGKKPLNKEP